MRASPILAPVLLTLVAALAAVPLAARSARVTAAPAAARSAARPSQTASIARGHAFARDHCTPCHAITANGSSPNPESPPFDDIANRVGITRQTMAAFLADAHNYPAAMNVTIDRAVTGDLAAYILTLRRPGYRPTR